MPKIFVIDDDPDLLKVVKTLSIKRSFDVSTFTGWQSANDALKKMSHNLFCETFFFRELMGLTLAID